MNQAKSSPAAIAPEKPPIGGAERFVTNLICVWLVIMPWLIGGRFWWVQALTVVVGLVALTVAARSAEGRGMLWRFPVFWLGLLFLGYVACQALNPWGVAMQRAEGINVWDVTTRSHVEWLPSGVSADYLQMSSWRMFTYWLGPWLLACAWWAAVRRRRSGRRLALVVFGNGVATALVVLVEFFHHPAKILWVFTDSAIEPDVMSNLTSSAGFMNHNSAAAYLYLALAAGLAVACRLQARANEETRDSGLMWIPLLGCLVILASLFAVGSRAGLILGCAVFLVGFGLMLATSFFGAYRSPGLWVGGVVVLLATGALVAYELHGENSGTIQRAIYLKEHPETSDARANLRQVALHMMQAHPWLGWGAGSFRYESPQYFYIDRVFLSSTAIGGLSNWTDFVHCDWLQFPLDYGRIGAGFVLAMLLYGLGSALRHLRRLGLAGVAALLGVGAMLAHSAVDYPMFNAAVFALFSMLAVSTLKTVSLSSRRSGKK